MHPQRKIQLPHIQARHIHHSAVPYLISHSTSCSENPEKFFPELPGVLVNYYTVRKISLKHAFSPPLAFHNQQNELLNISPVLNFPIQAYPTHSLYQFLTLPIVYPLSVNDSSLLENPQQITKCSPMKLNIQKDSFQIYCFISMSVF